jgi:hypothetical protein
MTDEVRAEPEKVVDLTDDSPLAKESPTPQPTTGQAPALRRAFAGALAVLAIIATIGAVDAIWVKTTLENEDRFVDTFGPLIEEDSVRSEVSNRVATRFVEERDVQSFFSDNLPSELGLLAAPLTGAVERVIDVTANQLLVTDAARDVWDAALRTTHTGVRVLLRGNDGAIESSDGTVSLDLNELADVIVAGVEARGIDLPQVTTDLGSITILESDQLAAAQTSARVMNTAGWFAPLVAVALIAAAIGFALNRRRMVIVLGFGTAIGVLIWLAVSRLMQGTIIGAIDSDTTREAATAAWNAAVESRRSLMWALLVLGVVIGVFAWLAGPSTKGEGVSRGAAVLDRWQRPEVEEPSPFIAFLSEWKRVIQGGILVLGVVFVLFGPTPTGLSVLVTALVVLVLVALVEVFAGPAPVSGERVS